MRSVLLDPATEMLIRRTDERELERKLELRRLRHASVDVENGPALRRATCCLGQVLIRWGQWLTEHSAPSGAVNVESVTPLS